ncbi:MAG TPA: hypothetical protein DCG28_05605 [Lachnospiraceae bacterium]|nr:hypothetical protein [Lachnospiraceae bacterium]
MLSFLKESFFVGTAIKAFNFFKNKYNSSLLCLIITKTANIASSSYTSKLLKSYVYKEPLYKTSLTNALIKKLSTIFDKLFDFLHNIFAKLIEGSLICNFIKDTLKKGALPLCLFFGLLLMSLSTGAMLIKYIFSSFTVNVIIIGLAVFLFGFILGFVGLFFNKIKESFIYSVIMWILEGLS